jgi:hypothetical protein
MDETKCICCLYDGNETETRIISNYGFIWDDKWHHLVFIVNSKTMTQSAYLDGQLIHSAKIFTTFSTSNSSDIHIANMPHYETYKYQGYMDDIYLFNFALTEKQVVGLYQITQ